MRDPRYVKVVEALARDIEECDRAEHQAARSSLCAFCRQMASWRNC
jgi:hypothetical protein